MAPTQPTARLPTFATQPSFNLRPIKDTVIPSIEQDDDGTAPPPSVTQTQTTTTTSSSSVVPKNIPPTCEANDLRVSELALQKSNTPALAPSATLLSVAARPSLAPPRRSATPTRARLEEQPREFLGPTKSTAPSKSSGGPKSLSTLSSKSIIASLDHWTVSTDDGIVEAPKLVGCGPWEMPLPANMSVQADIECHTKRLEQLLNVKVVARGYPPTLKVDLNGEKRAQEKFEPYLTVEHSASRWKAWRILFDWVKHVKLHGTRPARPPVDVVTFVRNRVIREGRDAQDHIMNAIREHKAGGLFQGKGTWQLPMKCPENLREPKFGQELAQKSEHSLEVSLAGQKRKLDNSSSDSSDEPAESSEDEPLAKNRGQRILRRMQTSQKTPK